MATTNKIDAALGEWLNEKGGRGMHLILVESTADGGGVKVTYQSSGDNMTLANGILNAVSDKNSLVGKAAQVTSFRNLTKTRMQIIDACVEWLKGHVNDYAITTHFDTLEVPSVDSRLFGDFRREIEEQTRITM